MAFLGKCVYPLYNLCSFYEEFWQFNSIALCARMTKITNYLIEYNSAPLKNKVNEGTKVQNTLWVVAF